MKFCYGHTIHYETIDLMRNLLHKHDVETVSVFVICAFVICAFRFVISKPSKPSKSLCINIILLSCVEH